MGTFTQERLQKVIDGFVLNGQTVSVEPYGNGHINDTFLLIMKEDGTEKKIYFAENERRYFQKQ